MILTLLFLAFGFYVIYAYLKNRNDYFKLRGIPGPKPKFLFGNLLDLYGTAFACTIRKWGEQFGAVYGFMEGGTPILVTSDLDVLHDIFVRKFNNFHGRKLFPLQPNPDTASDVSVFTGRGIRWKRLRAIANPLFSATKLKKVMPHMFDSLHDLLSDLDAASDTGAVFDIYPLWQDLTLDVIAKVAFGVETSIKEDPNNEHLLIAKKVFAPGGLRNNIFSLLATILPELRLLWRKISSKIVQPLRKEPAPGAALEKMMRSVVDHRRATKDSHEGRPDFVTFFMEAEAESGWEGTEALQGSQQTDLSALKIAKKLTPREIAGQCNVFLIAGYETTATSLSFLSYLLAQNQQVQEKLMTEIDSLCNDAEDLTYELIQQMTYLDKVAKESLRLFPLAALANSRTCMSTCKAGHLYIPEGQIVLADVWSIHYDKDIWGADADQFRPERFDQSEGEERRHPMAWIPFGAGPRQCIGLRFALLEEKLAICHLLKRYRLLPPNDRAEPLQLRGMLTISPKDVMVKLEKRY